MSSKHPFIPSRKHRRDDSVASTKGFTSDYTGTAIIDASSSVNNNGNPDKRRKHSDPSTNRMLSAPVTFVSDNESIEPNSTGHLEPDPIFHQIQQSEIRYLKSDPTHTALKNESLQCVFNTTIPSVLATSSLSGGVNLWNSLSGSHEIEPILTFQADSDPYFPRTKSSNSSVFVSLQWNSTGSAIATGSYDGVATVWNASGKLIKSSVLSQGPIMSIRWSPSDRLLAAANADTSVVLWDTAIGDVMFTYRGTSAATEVAWIDDKTLAVGTINGSVICLRIPGQIDAFDTKLEIRSESWEGHRALPVHSVQWDEITGYLATGGDDGIIKIWQVGRSESVFVLKEHTQEVSCLQWQHLTTNDHASLMNAKSRRILASSSADCTIRIWGIFKREPSVCLAVLGPSFHNLSVLSIAFSLNGLWLASGGKDGLVGIWSIRSSEDKYRLVGFFEDDNDDETSEHSVPNTPAKDSPGVPEANGDPKSEASAGAVVDLSWSVTNSQLCIARYKRKVRGVLESHIYFYLGP